MSLPDTDRAAGRSRPGNHYLISADAGLAGLPQPRWALGRLLDSLSRSGTSADLRWRDGHDGPAGTSLVVTVADAELGGRLLAENGITLPDHPGSFAIFSAGDLVEGRRPAAAPVQRGRGHPDRGPHLE